MIVEGGGGRTVAICVKKARNQARLIRLLQKAPKRLSFGRGKQRGKASFTYLAQGAWSVKLRSARTLEGGKFL